MKSADAKLTRNEIALALTIGFYLQLAAAIALFIRQGLTPASVGVAVGACLLGAVNRIFFRPGGV